MNHVVLAVKFLDRLVVCGQKRHIIVLALFFAQSSAVALSVHTYLLACRNLSVLLS